MERAPGHAPRVDAGRDHGNNLVFAVHAVEPVLVALDEELVVVVVALELVVHREGAALVGDAPVAAGTERDLASCLGFFFLSAGGSRLTLL